MDVTFVRGGWVILGDGKTMTWTRIHKLDGRKIVKRISLGHDGGHLLTRKKEDVTSEIFEWVINIHLGQK